MSDDERFYCAKCYAEHGWFDEACQKCGADSFEPDALLTHEEMVKIRAKTEVEFQRARKDGLFK